MPDLHLWESPWMGAGGRSRTPSRQQHQRRRIRARFRQGRWWNVVIEPMQPWAVLQVQLSTLMHRPLESFVMVANGQPVAQDERFHRRCQRLSSGALRPQQQHHRRRDGEVDHAVALPDVGMALHHLGLTQRAG